MTADFARNLPTDAGGVHRDRCICCGSPALLREWAALSTFFARRALLCAPRAVPLIHCFECNSRYFDLPVSEADLGRLYADYRGESYFRQRNRFEPWYTRAVNESIGSETSLDKRRAVLAQALAECGIANEFDTALDHGGDRGQMLRDVTAQQKFVYEISGVTPDPGIRSISQAAMPTKTWGLILSCHVLEHLPDPGRYIDELIALGDAETVYFFEVPDEAFRSPRFNSTAAQRIWISQIVKWPPVFTLLDFLSTAIRIKLRVVPPLLFVVLREHLTFFSTAGLRRLLEAKRLQVLSAKILPSGHIGVVARRA